VTADADSLVGLAPIERTRLERFAALFDRLDASQYSTLTEGSDSPDVESAKVRAQALVGNRGLRRDAVRSAIAAFTDAAIRAYAGRMSLPDTLLLFQSLPDRTEDRTRFLQSVERAVVALILWDELDDDDRAALVGPWASLVDPLVEA
jgi:hypothetical protein